MNFVAVIQINFQIDLYFLLKPMSSGLANSLYSGTVPQIIKLVVD